MQDNYDRNRRTPDDALLTIPASIVDWLRSAAYAEIGLTAETLDTAALSAGREAHPEWFRGPAETLRDIYTLLDTIGWRKTTPPLGVQIDPSENSWTLMRILASALEFADEHACESIRTTGTNAGHVTTAEPDAQSEQANALWNFMASIEAHTDTLAVEEGANDVLDIAA